jgi:MFS family permease
MTFPARGPASLRSLALSVYLPTFLFALGQGAVIPIIPLAARELGASLAFSAFVVALRGIGILAFDVPAGWLVTRLGEQRALLLSTALLALALAGAIWSPSPVSFALFTFLTGCGWSVWLLARLSYVTDVVPIELRGRALSTLGGVTRIGNFAGPIAGAAGAHWLGVDAAYFLHIASALLGCALLFCYSDEGEGSSASGAEAGHGGFLRVVREHADIFWTAGLSMTAVGAIRATRQGAFPLWADHIGLAPDAISVLYGISVGMEILLFYPAGSAMDRFGRKAIALPCLGIMSLGMLLLPLSAGVVSLLAVGLLIGFGNGIGSGIVMTLGADFSPPHARAQFLGAWRLCSDLGTAGGPLLFSAATALASLAAGSVLMGALGAVGVALILFRMPEPLRGADPRGEREPG